MLWNYVPTPSDRVEFGTEVRGGPYPTRSLDAYERHEVRIEQGDLYVFNGGVVHAVAAARGRRATISTLIGYCDDDTVVMWT